MTLLLVLLLWIVCGILVVGILMAHDYNFSIRIGLKFNYRETLGHAILFSLVFAPLMLIIAFFGTGFAEHGLMYRNPKR